MPLLTRVEDSDASRHLLEGGDIKRVKGLE